MEDKYTLVHILLLKPLKKVHRLIVREEVGLQMWTSTYRWYERYERYERCKARAGRERQRRLKGGQNMKEFGHKNDLVLFSHFLWMTTFVANRSMSMKWFVDRMSRS